MKRLLCLFDGTWNKPDGKSDVTNVVKLARVALGTAPDGVTQITRYVEGIGTDPDDSERQAFFEGAIGIGLDRRMIEGYRFLADHYTPGDEIYLFGFSRGAFQARSLGGLIGLVGLPPPQSPALVDTCWSYYLRHSTDPDAALLAELKAQGPGEVRIRCLGVWDTVGNLGVPLIGKGGLNSGYAFHDTELSPHIDVGLHALALDEPRGPFSPSLWTKRRGATLPPGQIIEQVWFAGSHANVGGGFPDSTLSDISLLWMAERAQATTGVAFDIERLRATTAPNPLGDLVSPTSDGIYRVSRLLPFVRLINQDTRGLSPWRRSLLGTWRTNLLEDGLEVVNESLHPSVIERFGKPVKVWLGPEARTEVYRPRPLAQAIAKTARQA